MTGSIAAKAEETAVNKQNLHTNNNIKIKVKKIKNKK